MKRPRTWRGWVALLLLVPLVLCFAIALLQTIGESVGALPTRTPMPTHTLPPTQTPRPTDTPRPPTATPTVVVYISADGDGVYLRSKPDREAKLTVWPDGSAMVVIERSPTGWIYVTAPDGVAGYVPVEYVTDKAPPTMTPVPTKIPTPTVNPQKAEAAAFQNTINQLFAPAEAAGRDTAAQAKAISEGRSSDTLKLYQFAKTAAEAWEVVKFSVDGIKVSPPLRPVQNDLMMCALHRESAYRAMLSWLDSRKTSDLAKYQDEMDQADALVTSAVSKLVTLQQ